MLAVALLQTGQPARAAEVLASSAGGEQVTLVPDVWRAYGLELMTSCWLELGRRPEAERAAAGAQASAAAVGLHLPTAMAHRAAAAVALDAGDPAEAAAKALTSAALADQVGAPVWAAVARTLAGRALGAAGRTRPGRSRARDRRRRVAAVRRSPIPRRRRARAPPARAAHPPAHATGEGRRDRHRIAHRARASDLATGRRPQNKPRNRRRALSQSEDDRDASTQHLPQTRRRLTRRRRQDRRASRPPRASRRLTSSPAAPRSTGASPMLSRPGTANLQACPATCSTTQHDPADCSVAFASFKGHPSPLRHRTTVASCLFGDHTIWWLVTAH